MSDRFRVAVAWSSFGVATALLLAGLAASAVLITDGALAPDVATLEILFPLLEYSFSIVGAVVVVRQPRNAVGWLLLGIGLAWQTNFGLNTYASWQWLRDGDTATALYADALGAGMWVPGLGLVGTFLLLLFPDGRLPSPRWRPWGWFSGVVLALTFVGALVAPGDVESLGPGAQNPLGIEALGELPSAPALFLPIAIAGCAGALVRRFRRSRGVERLQLKWLTAASVLAASVFVIAMAATLQYEWSIEAPNPLWVKLLQHGSMVSFALVPAAVGAAILRYRLYDIDRFINQTLVYGALSALLIGAYALVVFGASATLHLVTGGDQGNLAVAGSTLAVAALFRPLRNFLQRFIDRRFYRRKYDAAQTVEAFTARLRQETDLGRLADDLSRVVGSTIQPSAMTLWIAGDSAAGVVAG
jgi:hypothetical protein